ncbi:MAG: GerMN domain-containing protein [Geobacteraceae bacterium]|nr:GerMN domain-containing protein [Geobacteraceae bacterium]
MKRAQGKIRGGKVLLLTAFVAVALVLGALMLFKYLERHERPTVPQQPHPAGSIAVSLFFASSGTGEFVMETREIEACGSDIAPCIRKALEELANGPLGDLSPTIPPTSTVRSVQILNDTAIVDMGKGFVDGMPQGSSAEMTAAYSIVNTVSYNFPSVKKVKILIDGHEVTTLGGHLDLRSPLEPNYLPDGKEG